MVTINRRAFLAGAYGAAGAVALAGCGEGGAGSQGQQQPQGRTTLRLSGGDQGFPSPFAYRRGGGYIQTSFIYDPLVWKNASGQFIPWLAESYTRSPDGLTYTFRLRPNVRWQDGRPVTAEDVAFTYDYFRSQTISPQVIIQPLPEFREVRATGPRTIEFHLAAPLAPFFGFGGVGSVPIVPRHIWSTISNAATETDPAVLVGSGPYRLQSYARGEGSYLYEANDQFFLRRPFVRRLEFRPVGDDLNALLADTIDVAGGSGRKDALGPFTDNPDFQTLDAPPGNSGSGLFWNLGKGGALADVQFRRACARAINREDMVQRLLGGNGTAGNPGWIPPANPYHVDVEQYPFDRAAAESLLDDAGYRRVGGEPVRTGPDGRPLRFTMLVTSPPSKVTDLVVGALRAVGIEVTPEALDTPSFNRRVIAGDSEMSIISFGGMNTDHAPDYLLQVYPSYTRTTQHAQGYQNPEVDRLCLEQQHEVDRSRRMAIVGQIQQLVANDLPILPLVYPNSFTVFRTSAFRDWYYTGGGVASTVPSTQNKLAFVTGKKATPEIRPLPQAG
ncbi:MAG: ABC transporter substrate-binding protein [Pseudonocardiaceae bacterium]